MIQILQPLRPKPTKEAKGATTTLQQQRASSSMQAPPLPRLTSSMSQPRSQVEAVPPFGPLQTPVSFFTPVYNSASRHPVFFTEKLKKLPFPTPQSSSQSGSPVAYGYIAEERLFESQGRTKL